MRPNGTKETASCRLINNKQSVTQWADLMSAPEKPQWEGGGRGAHASDITAASATLWRVSDHSEAKSLFAHYVRPFVRAANENGDASVLRAQIDIARRPENSKRWRSAQC